MSFFILYLVSSILFVIAYASPRSKPFLPDGDISTLVADPKGRQYYNSTPHYRDNLNIIRHDSLDPSCNVNFKLKWSTTMGSSIFSTPLIFRNAEGIDHKKLIIANTYNQFVEMIDESGNKPLGWPLSFEDASFQSSPVTCDVDGDGILDIGVVDKNANLYWIALGDFGRYNENFHVQVPSLKVRKDWYVNLDLKFTDNQIKLSMFDRKREKLLEEGYSRINKKPFAKPDDLGVVEQITYPGVRASDLTAKSRRLEEESETESVKGKVSEENIDGKVPEEAEDIAKHGDDYLADKSIYGYESNDPQHRRRFLDDDYSGIEHEDIRNGDAEEFVFVDPHVLGNPALADVNGDGRLDIIMAVSYYFDRTKRLSSNFSDFDPEMYIAGGIVCWDLEAQDWAWMVHLDLTTDKSKFKALIYGSPTIVDLDGDGRSEVIIGTSLGLLYVLDGDTGFTKRHFPIQMSPIEAQVVCADILGGPDLEMIVVDMGGNIVAVDILGEILWDSKLSGTLPHPPTIGDIDGDGKLDVVIVAITADGSSHLWVLEGDTGLPLPNYPIALPRGATVSGPISIVDLNDNSANKVGHSAIMTVQNYEDPALPLWAKKSDSMPEFALSPSGANKAGHLKKELQEERHGLHLLVPSIDGHLYVINGALGCAERIDVGDHISSMPLVDDLNNDGYLDILIGTTSGKLMLLESTIPYHPLNSWTSFPNGRMNGLTYGQQGVSIPETQKHMMQFASLKGRKLLPLSFDIWDTRREMPESSPKRRYKVSIHRGLNTAHPLVSETYNKPGRYTILIPVSPPESSLFVLGMTNEYGQYFEDSVSISVSTKFYIWIKYLVVAPIALFTIPILLSR